MQAAEYSAKTEELTRAIRDLHYVWTGEVLAYRPDADDLVAALERIDAAARRCGTRRSETVYALRNCLDSIQTEFPGIKRGFGQDDKTTTQQILAAIRAMAEQLGNALRAEKAVREELRRVATENGELRRAQPTAVVDVRQNQRGLLSQSQAQWGQQQHYPLNSPAGAALMDVYRAACGDNRSIFGDNYAMPLDVDTMRDAILEELR